MRTFRFHAFPTAAGACLATVLALAAPVSPRAQGATATDPVEAAYQRDRTHCLAGMTHQARADCLREAAAARDTARRQQLGDAAESNVYQANAIRRCERLPQADRAACEARILGEGTTRGSVESGGIYRELIVPDRPK